MRHNIIPFLATLLLTLATACHPDDGDVLLTLHVEEMADAKMSVSHGVAHWTTGDSLCVNGTAYRISDASVSVASADGGYHAVFPAAITDGSSVTLPATYQYRTSGGIQLLQMPLAGCDDGNGHLPLQHLTAALVVKLRNDSSVAMSVDSLVVISDAYAISGTRTLDFADLTTTTAARAGSGAERRVTMLFDDEDLTLASHDSVYIMVPVAAVGNDNHFSVKVSSRHQGKRFIRSKTQTTGGALPCNTMAYATMTTNGTGTATDKIFKTISNTIMLIGTAKEFKLMAKAINEGWVYGSTKYSTFNYNITANINLGGDTIEALKSYTGSTFNGQSYTVSNLAIQSDRVCCALFDTIRSSSTVKNITLQNVHLISAGTENERRIGTLTGYVSGNSTFTNCIMDGVTVTVTGSPTGNIYFGGIAATAGGGLTFTFTNCHFDGDVTLSSNNNLYYGGLLGAYEKNDNLRTTNISSCYNSDTNIISLSATNYIYAGGLVGDIQRSTTTISNTTCLIKMNINATQRFYSGGMIGSMNILTGSLAFSNTNIVAGQINIATDPSINSWVGTIYGRGRTPGNTGYDATNLTITIPDNATNITTGDPGNT